MAVCTINGRGTKEWHLGGAQGPLHREDGPAREFANGSKQWYRYGKLHRSDGPAIKFPGGNKLWYVNDLRHRLDGPAVEYPDGRKYWYFEGHELTEAQHTRIRLRVARVEKARAHRIKWFILDRLLPKLCSPNSPAFLKRFHADWDAASL